MTLYARSRGVLVWTATLVCTAFAAWWCAEWLIDAPRFGSNAPVPVVAFAPLLAASAIIGSLHVHGGEIEESASRRLWRWRAGQMLFCTATYAAVLAATVMTKAAQFGAMAMIRNVVGCVGLAALGAVVLGARLCWLPMMLYTTTVYLSAPSPADGRAAVWAWPMQPGPHLTAWGTAAALFVMGLVVCSWFGPRTPLGGE